MKLIASSFESTDQLKTKYKNENLVLVNREGFEITELWTSRYYTIRDMIYDLRNSGRSDAILQATD